MKINPCFATIVLTCIFCLTLSCSSSPENMAKAEIAKSLAVDKEKLETSSYYIYTIYGGALDGKEFSTPVYAQGGIDTRKVEGLEGSTITFMDPTQGSSNFRIIWNEEDATPLTSKANPFGKNSYIELNLKVAEAKYRFLSDHGIYNIKSKQKWVKTYDTGQEFTNYDVLAEFEGEFTETSSGEKVKIKGLVNGFTMEKD